MRELLTLAGPLFVLLGVLAGTWGTLLMCRSYHPFGTWKVLLHLLAVAGMVVRGKFSEASDSIRGASDFSSINPENRFRTLEGVYVLVFSFLLQTLGAILILADSYLISRCK
jgi:hypothetical protein